MLIRMHDERPVPGLVQRRAYWSSGCTFEPNDFSAMDLLNEGATPCVWIQREVNNIIDRWPTVCSPNGFVSSFAYYFFLEVGCWLRYRTP